ncbi:MAG: Holo-[acyl-carrier-protein] synthase [Gammaproteobacteria bacterium]|nr:Holo-[acyl-carrier-protein] synthase [Gammaproteobacteria bacterium]
MIIGIGVDMVRIARMRTGMARYGERLARRILHDSEYARFAGSRRKPEFLAQRFAAKEAAAKALGTGFAGGVYACDIIVGSDARGKPLLEFVGGARDRVDHLGVTRSHVSLSDEGEYSIAMVTLEGCQPRNSS